MQIILKTTLFLGLVISVVSCRQIDNIFDSDVLAEVGDAVLYQHDVASIFTPGMPSEDSVKMLKSYVDRWVRNQLKVQEAENVFASSQKDIDKMVEDYRSQLMTVRLDQYYVDNVIDTLFTDQQVADYYNENKKDFVLDKTIVKARVVKLPVGFRQQKELKDKMLSSSEDGYRDFVGICLKNGFELTEFNTWSDFSQVEQLLPRNEDGYADLLSMGRIHEIKDGGYIWLIRMLDYRKQGDYAPTESVQDVIKRVIFNKRKQDIIQAREDSLYNMALEKKEVVINVN